MDSHSCFQIRYHKLRAAVIELEETIEASRLSNKRAKDVDKAVVLLKVGLKLLKSVRWAKSQVIYNISCNDFNIGLPANFGLCIKSSRFPNGIATVLPEEVRIGDYISNDIAFGPYNS